MKKQWWHDKIAYQIYPKSFMDSNGDGVGDLEGIIRQLDYLQALGVDLVWLSPVYKTPFVDQGYDIADYYQIDPLFGSMEDMDRLLAEAKKRNIHILMDLVVNHCSDQHRWFQEAIKDPEGKYGRYFIIKDSDREPNNWRSYFGGSVWDKLPGHDNKYYLHLFAKEQPDLNWENPDLVAEVYKNVNWWLEKGLKGFRIDAIVNIKKDLSFADLEADGPDMRAEAWKMLDRAGGLLQALQALKAATFAKHDAFTVAELFNYDQEKLGDYIGDKGCFSTIFDFSTHLIGKSIKGWYDSRPVAAKTFRQTIFDATQMAEGKGYLCNIIENHDTPRGVNRYIQGPPTPAGKKMLACIFMLRKGLPFIYQGQEIGMTNCDWQSIEEINDISTIDQYGLALRAGYSRDQAMAVVRKYSRDNARTPMQWTDGPNAGFSQGQPWLKLNPNYKDINVARQESDPDSVLNYYKALIRLRKSPAYKEVFVYGDMVPAYDQSDQVFGFYRRTRDKQVLVLANMGPETISLGLKEKNPKCLLHNGQAPSFRGPVLDLQGHQALVFALESHPSKGGTSKNRYKNT